MNKETISLEMEVYESIEDLEERDARLLRAARSETKNAYAPYSQFRVGAAALLTNGELVKGTNQENASFPAGICAERVLLSTASSLFPGMAIESLAISYDNINGNSDKPISPCGICRQSIYEFQSRTKHPIRIIMGGQEGKIFVLENAASLLPMVFGAEDMQ